MQHVLGLERCGHDIRHAVGGKAAGLGAMLALGLNVPAGFAVTTRAYRTAVAGELRATIEALVAGAQSAEELREASARIRDLFTADLVDDALRAEIVGALSKLGDPDTTAVAVRSSATAEDLAEASFAGQQDTYLWIRGASSVVDAVVRCWASLFTAQVIEYRRRFDIDTADLAMAVVVQCMVPADAAGVMMTLDPATGDRASVYIEAAYGLGEGVVKGDVTSDSYWVSGADSGSVAGTGTGTATGSDTVLEPGAAGPVRSEVRRKTHAHQFDESAGEVRRVPVAHALQDRPALTEKETLRIAALGRLLEDALGGPQDVEWAFAGGPGTTRELFLLQTRAETVWSRSKNTPTAQDKGAVAAPAMVDPDETTLLHGHSARDGLWTVTNMAESIPGVSTPMTWSVWLPAAEFVNRSHYRFIGALSRLEAQLPHRTQDWIVGVFYGRFALRVDLLADWADRIPGMSGQDVINQFFSSLPGSLGTSSARKRHLSTLVRKPAVFLLVPRRMRANRAAVERYWRTAVAELPGADAARTMRILDEAIELFTRSLALQVNLTQGAFLATSKALGDLAAGTGVSPNGIVGGSGGHEESAMVEDLWACSRGRKTLEEFLDRHGYHGWREGELSHRSWREDPTMVRRQLDAYRSRPDSDDPRRSAKQHGEQSRALRRKLLAALPPRRRPYARAVMAATTYYGPMRGVSKAAFSQALDVVRAAVRRMGEHLAAQGEIAEADDVFYLTVDEVRNLRVPHGRELVSERKELRRRYETVEVPDAWRGVPEPYSVEPGEAVATVAGTPASPGIAEGLARVVLDPGDAHVEEGEILFARDTDPAWASLMFLSSALVADIGGVMSHTAVVARELGIPCVVNTKVATRHVRTGDRVRIDGAAGTVEILERAREPR
ncbi:PEP/pyruvate-binding domain-containing protein [Streptomyces sp. NPDC058001]|uniref:PEP/pyruvate-binding domain-containing protein n=1 Tax=Streptomyces sp. NPDC058001 TaxID=3346300 RepID=UPI0036E660F9